MSVVIMDTEVSISTASFYGSGYKVNEKIVTPIQNFKDIVPFKIKDLVNGPSITWKVFKKQAEALDFISKYKHDLMAFAFESDNTRLFLVAHPEVFWHYDCQRPSNCRCSYEIIPENSVCKLYFDLEFNIPLNPTSNGPRMVQNFIGVVIYYIKEQFNVECNLNYVINLDASTKTKFSRHLIFNIPNVCFATNHQAGNFVNFICTKILDVTKTKLIPPGIKELTHDDCLEMIVLDVKNQKALFCDLSVYSRNRHFRLYKSTKYGKFAPLLPSLDSMVVINDNNSDRDFFLSSLITYIPTDYEKLKVLYFEKSASCQKLFEKKYKGSSQEPNFDEIASSPYKGIDNFISELVYPGKIYRSFYFHSSKIINYDIVGNRFCGNIGRQHKNNNVKYVVDMKDGTYYQKCHDYECSAYRSTRTFLPKNLQLSDFVDSTSNLGVFDICRSTKSCLERFPSCGLSDEEIMNHFSNQAFKTFPSFDLSAEEMIKNLPSNSLKHFPSFDLTDEEIVNHLSAENFDF